MEIDNEKLFKINESDDIVYTTNYAVMFYFDNNQYFFKEDNGFGSLVETELLASKIGQKLGVDTVEVKPAVFCAPSVDREIVGVFAKNFHKDDVAVNFNNEIREFLVKNNYDSVVKAVKKYINDTKIKQDIDIKLEPKFYQKLLDMIFFDFVTLQADRHEGNYEFLLKKVGNCWQLGLAPIFDNSWIFGIQEVNRTYVQKSNIQDYIKGVHRYIFGFKQCQKYENIKNDILYLCRHSDRYRMLAKRVLDIDVLECIDELENENPGIVFDEGIKNVAKYCWQIVQNDLKNSLQSDLQVEDNPSKDCSF